MGNNRRESPGRLKVLFVSSEAGPFARTGGLGDVAGSLPAVLRAQGADIRLVLPFYMKAEEGSFPREIVIKDLDVPLGDFLLKADVLGTEGRGGLRVFLVEREDLYARPNLYGNEKGDYYDNFERFTFFSHACLRIAEALDFRPDVIHCNDWQTGLVPALVTGPYRGSPVLRDSRLVFTIHNIAYQGVFPKEKLRVSGMPEGRFFHPEGLEYWGNISLLKAGIVYSDVITTVSPRYAEEIMEPEYGLGMEGILKKRRNRVHGILNGVDYETWDPVRDPHLANNYDVQDMTGKRRCKEALLKEMGLASSLIDQPLLGMISRLDGQKGFGLLVGAIERILAEEVGLVILGSGNHHSLDALRRASERYPEKMAFRWGFDEPLSHRIMGGADIILVPSKYEPCGLTQMYAMRYGTVPVVRATGGLDDSVREFEPETGKGNGFKFRAYEPEALLEAVEKALRVYGDRVQWRTLMSNAMKEDFSWERSAREYVRLYEALVAGSAGGQDVGKDA